MPGLVAVWLPTASRATPGAHTALAGHGSPPNGWAPLAGPCATRRTAPSRLRPCAVGHPTRHAPSPLALASADQRPRAPASAHAYPACAAAPSARRIALGRVHTTPPPAAIGAPP